MGLVDIWDYVRAMGDRRLRKQGYVSSGMGILERYRRATSFWAPHLERNRGNLLNITVKMNGSAPSARPSPPAPLPRGERGERPSGTLLILGAGRLLDVPYEQLFPLFERVVLFDADYCIVSYVERIIAAAKAPGIPKPSFEIGDLTASVVDTAAWAEHTISSSNSPAAAAKTLIAGFEQAGTPQPDWARSYSDVRMVVSTNLISQLGYFPRLHVQNEFKKRFNEPFSKHAEAAEALEKYFDRVRARHIHDLASLKKAWAYVSTDVNCVTYALEDRKFNLLTCNLPADAGVTVNDKSEVQFAWPAAIIEHSDPLHGQKVKELWPRDANLEKPQRWVWHIVPQGSEKAYQDRGRVHVVESWVKAPKN